MSKTCYCVVLDLSEPIIARVYARSEEDIENIDKDELADMVLENDPGFRITGVYRCEDSK